MGEAEIESWEPPEKPEQANQNGETDESRPTTVLDLAARRLNPLDDHREAVLRDLADGSDTDAEVGRRYGVTRQAVFQWKRKNAAAIDVARQRMTVTLDSLWAAQKELRIRAMVEDYEQSRSSEYHDHFKQITARTEIMNSISEQLGQTPPRQQVVVMPVVHVVLGGVDLSDLQ